MTTALFIVCVVLAFTVGVLCGVLLLLSYLRSIVAQVAAVVRSITGVITSLFGLFKPRHIPTNHKE